MVFLNDSKLGFQINLPMTPFHDKTTGIRSFRQNRGSTQQMIRLVEDWLRLKIELKLNLMKTQSLKTSMISMFQHLNLVMKDYQNWFNQKKQLKFRNENSPNSTRLISILSNRLIKKTKFLQINNDHFH